MRCPTLTELPPPPPGKTGWPWTAESAQLPDTMPDGAPWPRVSIVTPSYNQAQFIEETIRSVLLQGYPDLEYIIIDGGSTDGSVEIIRKYEPWLAYWVSEKDRGQSHALNKGFRRATGDIVGWLNSDDTYQPEAIARAIDYLSATPDCALVYCDCHVIDKDSHVYGQVKGREFIWKEQLLKNSVPQQGVFVRRSALGEVGGVDETLHYIMDYELWLRLGHEHRLGYVEDCWANFRVCTGTKSSAHRYDFALEHLNILEHYATEAYGVEAASREKAMRYWHLIALLEGIRENRIEDNKQQHIAMAFDGGKHPFEDLQTLSQSIIALASQFSPWPGVGVEVRACLREFFLAMSSFPLKKKLQAQVYMDCAFASYQAGEYDAVIYYGGQSLSHDWHGCKNRGFLKMLVKSVWRGLGSNPSRQL